MPGRRGNLLLPPGLTLFQASFLGTLSSLGAGNFEGSGTMVFGGTAHPCVYKNGTYGSLARADAYLLKDGPSRHLLDAIRRAVPRTNWLRSARAKWRSPWPVTSGQAFYFQYSASSPKNRGPHSPLVGPDRRHSLFNPAQPEAQLIW